MENKKYNIKGNRILKIEPNNINIHPLTLEMIKNNDNDTGYFTKYFIDNDKINNISKNSNNSLENKFMLTPSLLLPHYEYLKIHNINDINDLVLFIDNNLNNYKFPYINRILNCWIRTNFTYLKKNNNILLSIYNKIFEFYFKSNIFLNKNIINNESKKFINNWFKNKNSESFFINFGNDFEKYLTNKYGI